MKKLHKPVLTTSETLGMFKVEIVGKTTMMFLAMADDHW